MYHLGLCAPASAIRPARFERGETPSSATPAPLGKYAGERLAEVAGKGTGG